MASGTDDKNLTGARGKANRAKGQRTTAKGRKAGLGRTIGGGPETTIEGRTGTGKRVFGNGGGKLVTRGGKGYTTVKGTGKFAAKGGRRKR